MVIYEIYYSKTGIISKNLYKPQKTKELSHKKI